MAQPDFSSFQADSPPLPTDVSGRLVGIDPVDRMLHAIEVRQGRAVAYRSRSLPSDLAATNVLAFGGAVLVLGDRVLAREVSSDLVVGREVDLAGLRRAVCEFPRYDAINAELHLIATAADGTQSYVVVSAGAFTRRNTLLGECPGPVLRLAVERDRLLFETDGFVGATTREASTRITWSSMTSTTIPVLDGIRTAWVPGR